MTKKKIVINKKVKNKVVKEELLKGKVNPDLCLHDDHDFPTTRRGFLAAGLISSASTVVLPTLGSFLSGIQKARGQEQITCGASSFSPAVPLYIIEGAGGMNIPGNNVLPGFTENGNTMDGWSTILPGQANNAGISPNAHPTNPAFVVEWGGLHWHAYSELLFGIQDAIATSTQANGAPILVNGTDTIEEHVAGILTCIDTNDDSDDNQHHYGNFPKQMIPDGSQLTYGVQNGNIRSAHPPGIEPVFADVSNGSGSLLDMDLMQQQLTAGNTEQKLEDLMTILKNMSQSYVDRVLNRAPAYQAIEYIQARKPQIFCPSDKAPQLFAQFSAAALAPNDLSGIYTDAPTNSDAQSINLVCRPEGICHVGGETRGGCDYHNNGLDNNGNKDIEVGRAIGRALCTAALRGVKIVIQLITDGGVSSNGQIGLRAHQGLGIDVEKCMFTNDNGGLGSQLAFFFDPTRKRQEFRTSEGNQYGSLQLVNGNSLRVNSYDTLVAGHNLMHEMAAFQNDGDNSIATAAFGPNAANLKIR